MNEEYLVGLFRKALIEAKANNMALLGALVLDTDGDRCLDEIVYAIRRNDRYENLLRDEKALRKLAKAVIEAAK